MSFGGGGGGEGVYLLIQKALVTKIILEITDVPYVKVVPFVIHLARTKNLQCCCLNIVLFIKVVSFFRVLFKFVPQKCNKFLK